MFLAKTQVILYNNNLVATDLTDTMVALSAMPSLAWVDLSGNVFNGASLPATIPTGLKLLRLRNSQLAGSIPSELGAWSTLEHVDVSKNSISAVSATCACQMFIRNTNIHKLIQRCICSQQALSWSDCCRRATNHFHWPFYFLVILRKFLNQSASSRS